MDARKRKVIHSGRPGVDLTPRERDCLDAVRNDVEAREALDFLVQKAKRTAEWCTEKWWITNFVLTAWTAQTIKESHGIPPGESEPEELLKFVGRIVEMAGTIRKLNSERHWYADCPDAAIFPDEEKHRDYIAVNAWNEYVNPAAFNEVKTAFQNLPRVLEMYAESVRMKAMREIGYKRLDAREQNLQHRLEIGLLETVQRMTGRKYREKVTAILRVVNAKAGVRPVESEALRKREQRMKVKLTK